jgi:hypothetical protein
MQIKLLRRIDKQGSQKQFAGNDQKMPPSDSKIFLAASASERRFKKEDSWIGKAVTSFDLKVSPPKEAKCVLIARTETHYPLFDNVLRIHH